MTDTAAVTPDPVKHDEGDAIVQAVDDSAALDIETVEPLPDELPPEVPPMPQPKPQPVIQRRRGSGWLGAVMGGVLAAGAGYGVAQLVPGGWPIADTSALEAQLSAQAAEIAALKADIARVSELASAPQPMPDSGLADRVAAVEAAVAGVETPDLTQPLAAVEARLAALEAMPVGEGTGASAGALAALQAQVTALTGADAAAPAEMAALVASVEAQIADAQAQAEALKAEAAALSEAAMQRAALGQLRAALDTGAPFGSALESLAAADLPAVLTDAAQAGVPTLQALQAAFPDAARLALEASLRANMGEGWADRIGAYLRNQTGARSLTPREGSDPDAVLSRAEAALAKGDLGVALTELSALPPEGLAAMADWQRMAGIRQSAVQAVAAVAAALGE